MIAAICISSVFLALCGLVGLAACVLSGRISEAEDSRTVGDYMAVYRDEAERLEYEREYRQFFG
jgi:hypothetical protein